MELIMLQYPMCRQEAEVACLLETYMELMDVEVAGKQKELMLGTVKGILRAKLGYLSARAVPEIHLPVVWL